jgi:hypothetical protein
MFVAWVNVFVPWGTWVDYNFHGISIQNYIKDFASVSSSENRTLQPNTKIINMKNLSDDFNK